jgi:hypothetical protein
MNKRQSDSVWIIVAVVCISVFMLWAAPARGITVVENEKGERFVMMTMQEAAALNAGIRELIAERDHLKERLAKGGCT